MANESDIARWRQGRGEWNTWATTNAGRSVDFTDYVFEVDADFSNFVFPGPADFSRSVFRHRAEFPGAHFRKGGTFRNVEFQLANFNDAVFDGYADFANSKFTGDGGGFFHRTVFNCGAHFTQAECSFAHFTDAKFAGRTNINGAKFDGALFNNSVFEGLVRIQSTKFGHTADFSAITSNGVLLLTNSTFERVPDLTDSYFRSPPRFDGMHIEDPLDIPSNDKKDPRPTFLKFMAYAPTEETSPKYRRLKGLAIEGHDHHNELNFFADELRSRRFRQDSATSANFWLGVLYENFSDFGRSISRPLIAWVTTVFVFACVYGTGSRSGELNGSWVPPELALSLFNSFPIIGFLNERTREGAISFLFENVNGPTFGWHLMFVCQNLWATVLVFLLLLGLRNRFRIK